ncbi:hypothetical protein E4P41_18640 [Geodermatophilus sp. DF01-2]|uniref:hypothetical protein n=1 Tax=Geodermatophilus sp. DF01-2 TaxID=2559610 RepID=UPI0010735D9E|nr:hypothetical protein [Geodermatophilus sp. DF01_2]TFV54602.1 hypothetical protein E4P41_18640 [Geodermatophilus sp. DF01_2]
MPPSDPRSRGERPGDRPDGDESTARGRRGRLLVSGVVLAGVAVVLAVFFSVARCGSAVSESGSADRPQVVEEAARPAPDPDRL